MDAKSVTGTWSARMLPPNNVGTQAWCSPANVSICGVEEARFVAAGRCSSIYRAVSLGGLGSTVRTCGAGIRVLKGGRGFANDADPLVGEPCPEVGRENRCGGEDDVDDVIDGGGRCGGWEKSVFTVVFAGVRLIDRGS